MKMPRLANAMSYIDDDLVSCAVEYKSNSRKKCRAGNLNS